ncbi:MAG TPA: MerR family transcriptional regulator [Iamia sp.]|nr:MerR family transcriptional regulator [Iamia sp.]
MTRTIGELAEAAGVAVDTVRFYERRGLLPPPPRTPSGYRQYDDDALDRLRFILRAKELGFTLAEIDGLMPARSTAVRSAAVAKIEALDAEAAELARVRARLELLVARCDEGDIVTCEALSIGARPRGGSPGSRAVAS